MVIKKIYKINLIAVLARIPNLMYLNNKIAEYCYTNDRNFLLYSRTDFGSFRFFDLDQIFREACFAVVCC